MEEEIDLRPYIEAIVKHWYWIIGATILAGLLTIGLLSVVPPQYEATALVAVTIPQELRLSSLTSDNLAPSLVTQNESLSYMRALPELTKSDQLLQELLQTMEPQLESISTIEDLKDLLEADAASDPALIRLKATHKDPEIAAQIANQWAKLFVPRANSIFGLTSSEQVFFWESQLTDNRTNLENIEQEIIAFEANNRVTLLQNSLNFSTRRQSDLLAKRNLLQTLSQDVQLLKTQIEALPDDATITFAQQLTALNLQLRTFGAQNNTLQLQVEDDTDLTFVNKSDQLDFLNELKIIISTRLEQLELELGELEPEILDLQLQLQEARTEQNRLNRKYTEAEEAYIALSRKVETERLTAADEASGVRLASISSVPQEPSGSNLLIPLVVMMFVSLLSVLVIIGITWFKG